MKATAREWLAMMSRAVDASRLTDGAGDDPLSLWDGWTRLADWKAIEREGERIFAPVVLEIIQAAGLTLSPKQRRRILKDRIDPIGDAAVKWAKKNTATLVKDITSKTKAAIRAAIARGINQGWPIGQTKAVIRRIVGLTDRQFLAVMKQYDKAVALGLDTRAADKFLKTLTERARSYRAELIAQTETARAAAAGILSAYEKNAIEMVQWIADLGPGCCEACVNLDGLTFPLHEAQGMLPQHPNCECAWVRAEQ